MRLLPVILVGTVVSAFSMVSQPSIASPISQPGARQIAAASLGDLSSYKSIATDALALIKKGDIAAAQKRGTDLETAWDTAEDTMKPLDPARWRVVDKAIDRVLSQLRAPTPEVAGCATALTDLIAAVDRGGAA